jgi:hypothetical protein
MSCGSYWCIFRKCFSDSCLNGFGKDLKPDNILVKLDHTETVVEIENEMSTEVSMDSTLSPQHILSRPIRAFSSVELLDLIETSKLDVQLTDFGTGKLLMQLPTVTM